MWRDPFEEPVAAPVIEAPATEPPAVRDRRRPGRPATVNPHLIPLLRAPAKAKKDARLPDLPPPVPGIGVADVVLLLLPLWGVCGAIFWFGW